MDKAVKSDPRRPDLHYQLAGVLSGLGEYETALSHCQTASQLDPGYSDAIAGQAEIHHKRGEYQEACNLIKPLLLVKPVNIQAAIVNAGISKHVNTGVNSITLLESIAETQNPTSQEQIQIHSALGKLYDRAGNYDKAFENFKRSNIVRESEYKPAEHEKVIDAIIGTFSPDLDFPESSNRSEIPIFIIGMPRSGTTLIEQILASHPKTTGMGEFLGITQSLEEIPGTSASFPGYIPELDAKAIDFLSNELMKRIQASAPDASRIVINERPSYLFLGLLRKVFPGARFLHSVRNPLDTCLSCYFQLLSSKYSYACRLEHLGHYYRQYRRLMNHWEHTLNIPIFTINYEDMVNNQVDTTRALIEFCELPWDDSCLRFYEHKRNVVTPSYDDVHQPIYKTSTSPRWKNYEHHILELIAMLGEID